MARRSRGAAPGPGTGAAAGAGGSAGPPAAAGVGTGAAGRAAAGFTLSTRMWGARREAAKFPAQPGLAAPSLPRLPGCRGGPGAAPAGPGAGGSGRVPGAQPACGRKTKGKGRTRAARREGGREGGEGANRSVTWRLFSLSARALLGAVVPEEEEEAGGGGHSAWGRAVSLAPRQDHFAASQF